MKKVYFACIPYANYMPWIYWRSLLSLSLNFLLCWRSIVAIAATLLAAVIRSKKIKLTMVFILPLFHRSMQQKSLAELLVLDGIACTLWTGVARDFVNCTHFYNVMFVLFLFEMIDLKKQRVFFMSNSASKLVRVEESGRKLVSCFLQAFGDDTLGQTYRLNRF